MDTAAAKAVIDLVNQEYARHIVAQQNTEVAADAADNKTAPKTGKSSDSPEEREAMSLSLWRDMLTNHEKFMEILYELHSVEARLALLALPHIVEEVEKIRHAVTSLASEAVSAASGETGNQDLTGFINGQHTLVVTMMAIAYKDA